MTLSVVIIYAGPHIALSTTTIAGLHNVCTSDALVFSGNGLMVAIDDLMQAPTFICGLH